MWQTVFYPYRKVLPLIILLYTASLLIGLFLQAHPELIEARQNYGVETASGIVYPWHENLSHWDIYNEMQIVREWYTPAHPDLAVKFPFLSGTTRAIWLLTGGSISLIITLVAKAGLLFGFAEFWRLMTFLKGERFAHRAVCWLAFPFLGTGYVWLMNYPEGWYLGFWSAALYLFFRNRDFAAGLAAAAAVLTRPQGMLLTGVLGLAILWKAFRLEAPTAEKTRYILRRGLAVGLLPVMVWLAWVLHVSDLVGLELAPYSGQRYWSRTAWVLPWQTLYRFAIRRARLGFNNAAQVIVTAQILLMCFSLLYLFRAVRRGKLRGELWLYSLLALVLPLTSQIVSIGRYALLTVVPLTPLYLPGRWQRRIARAEPFMWIVLGILSVALTMIINTVWDVSANLQYVP